ncbi:MAG: outer membrane lipoprotein-sorting protein [Proteobacteria bacterium]|nr:MAG: outer membrane lipoprotein-sorting protein [Pseudomonadota bacterium]
MKNLSRILIISLSLGLSGTSYGKVSQQEADKLGKELTPLGAERQGNPEGTIPPWTGGITTLPEGYRTGAPHIDPFSADIPEFKIDSSNINLYKSNLTEGQQQLVRQYAPDYYLNVYPSRRSASYPARIYATLKKNAVESELLENGNGVKNTMATSPFPVPGNGLEILWNHILRYRGEQAFFRSSFVTPTIEGRYRPIRVEYSYYFAYSEPGITLKEIDNKIFYLRTKILSPTKLAGTLNLVHETLDQVHSPRKAWRYQTGERRLRRAPAMEYSTDLPNSSSLRTIDQLDMYNGAPNQYHWTVTGKKEIYIPYNAYKLDSKELEIKDIIRPRHIDQSLARYELHRVWVIEGILRKGLRHIYHKRRFFLDEDSWQIVLAEEYDKNNTLWRVSEAHTINYYEKPLLWSTVEVTYDLKSGRYFAQGLDNEENPVDFSPGFKRRDFSTSAARRAAKR